MSSSNDAAVIEEQEIAREFRARLRARQEAARARRKHSNKIATGPGSSEETPLLGRGDEESVANGTANGEDDGNEPEWFGYAELRQLPWWKRPSVCAIASFPRSHANLDRYTGSYLPSCYSPWHSVPSLCQSST